MTTLFKTSRSLLRQIPLARYRTAKVPGGQIRISHDNLNPEEPFKFGLKEEFLFRNSQTRFRSTQVMSTLNESEVEKFRALAKTWWDPNGLCKPLHSLNPLRVSLVRDGLVHTGRISTEESPKPLVGVRILDVGCGGGILSESLARLGASVVGLDAAEENIEIANAHAKEDAEIKSNLCYICSTVEDFAKESKEPFDAVIASEVIEHVENQHLFVKTCASLVQPNGSVFFTTLNRNRSSYLAGIIAAEHILGLLPVGTHDWNKFVKPEELDDWLKKSGCQTRLVHGMFYFPIFNKWTWIPQATVNYATHAVKLQ